MMQVNIGKNLRRFRMERGLTQEQVAEVFGVSPQAVSRWENNSAYPDITLLPGIATFYGKSTDEIIGMDNIRREENLWGIHGEVNRLIRDGEAQAAAALIRDSLKLYPNDSGLLMTLGETLAHMDDEGSVYEAIKVEERVLADSDASIKARCTTMVNLIFLYMKAGMRDKAARTVKSLPHIWEAREMIMPEAHEGGAYVEELKKAVVKALVYLSMRIETAKDRSVKKIPDYVQLGVDFEPKMSTAEMLGLIGDFLNE